MPGWRRRHPSPDRHIGLSYAPRAQHLPARGSGKVFLGRCGSRRHTIWRTLVDPPAVGQNMPRRMASTGVVEWCRAMALTRCCRSETIIRPARGDRTRFDPTPPTRWAGFAMDGFVSQSELTNILEPLIPACIWGEVGASAVREATSATSQRFPPTRLASEMLRCYLIYCSSGK